MAPIKVATYNIHGGAGADGKADISRIGRVLQTAVPDIISLNEVNRYYAGAALDSKLAEQLGPGWTSTFGKTIYKPLGEYGNAILTRLPIVSSESWLLSDYPHQERRGLLRVTVMNHGSRVHIFCVHMGLDQEMRERHAREILQIMDRFGDAPRILLGDFNEETGNAGVDLIARTFRDTWKEFGIGEGDTFSSGRPFRRIDFIWTDRSLAATDCYVARWTDARMASDHLPVFANLTQAGETPDPIIDVDAGITQSQSKAPKSGAFAMTREVLKPVFTESFSNKKKPALTVPEKNDYSAGVASLGSEKVWRQRSRKTVSFQNDPVTTISARRLVVSARVKTVSIGSNWRLTASGDGVEYGISVEHEPGRLPVMSLLYGGRIIGHAVLSACGVDPYDWNDYQLELDGERLKVYVDGRRIADAVALSAFTPEKNTSTSIVLTTSGDGDNWSEIYADDLSAEEWVNSGNHKTTAMRLWPTTVRFAVGMRIMGEWLEGISIRIYQRHERIFETDRSETGWLRWL